MSKSEKQAGRWTALRIAITVVLTAAIVAPATAWASHQFTDVPNSNVFHGDIDWMRDNGVTKGCNPPANDEYCPDDFVTREQMAAFMHRLESEGVFLPADGKAADADELDGQDSSAFLGATDKAADADELDGQDSSAFLGAGLDEFIPIARISIRSTGVTGSSHRAPITGAPTATHDGTKYTVNLPGIAFNVNTWQALCTVREGSAHDVTVNSVSGNLLVYIFDSTDSPVAEDAHCMVYREL